MLILAMDTSGPSFSVALWRDRRLLAEMTAQNGQPHSTTLMPVTESLLSECGLKIMDIDAYACTVGPGSYTGLRIGVSTTKALAYAAGKPVAGISTLAAIAWPYRCIPGLIVCSMIDARNRRLFAGAWLEDRAIIDEANCRDSDFVAALQTFITQQTEAQAVSGLLLVGHQPEAFFESSGKPLLAGTRQAPAAAALPRAAVVAEMAEIKLMQGESGSPLELLPRYLSPSQAERRKTEPA